MQPLVRCFTGARLVQTLGPVQSAWLNSGLIGQGVGVTGQEARYAGNVQERVRISSAEVGLGMILIELGLPGLLAMVWLGFMLVGRVWLALRILAWTAPELLNYASGFLALLIANAATFGTATQLYSDFVVLITLGLVGGLLFALLTFGLMEERRQRMMRWRAAHGDVMGWGAGQGPGGHTR